MGDSRVSFIVRVILILSVMVSVISGVLATARSGPDERHHYSFSKYVAEHPSYPPRYEHIFTDKAKDYNHLVHPPLYYYLVAGLYSILDPTEDQSSVLDSLDAHGRFSSAAVIPVLRVVSWLLVAVGAFGVYSLLRLLSVDLGLSRPMTIVAALLSSFIPAATYIGGLLNNDALVLAIWPWLVFYSFEFWLRPRFTPLAMVVTLCGAAVLTKASLWALALLSALAVGIRLASMLFRRQGARELLPRDATAIACGVLAVTFAGLTLSYLAITKERYGTIRPSYVQVYGLSEADSKFSKVKGNKEELAQARVSEVFLIAGDRIIKSLSGVLAQQERIYPQNHRLLLYILLLSPLLIIVANAGVFLRREPRLFAVFALWVAPALFTFFFLEFAVRAYRSSGYFGAQGRYFIGYLQLLIFGLCLQVSLYRPKSLIVRTIRSVGTGLGFLGLAFVLCRPLAFIDQTDEIAARSKIQSETENQLLKQGYTAVPLIYGERKGSFVEIGDEDRTETIAARFFLLGWTFDAVCAALPTEKTKELLLWFKGDSQLGEEVQVKVSYFTSWVENKPSGPVRERVITLAQESEIVTEPSSMQGEAGFVCLRITNREAELPWPVSEVASIWRFVRVYGVYAR